MKAGDGGAEGFDLLVLCIQRPQNLVLVTAAATAAIRVHSLAVVLKDARTDRAARNP